MKLDWNDQQGARDRQSWLLLISRGKVSRFHGESIPGVVAVLGRDYHKGGKWSYHAYRMELAEGVVPIPFRDGWGQGTLLEGLSSHDAPCDRWADLANRLSVPVSEARRFLEEEAAAADTRFGRRAVAALKALDAADAALAAIDDADDEAGGDGAVVLGISFGSPRSRDIRAGYWDWPIRVLADGTEVDALVCENGEYRIGKRILHDHTPHGNMTFKEVIEKSSNIGTVKAASRLGAAKMCKYMKVFGFYDKTGIDLPGEVIGMNRPLDKWSGVSMYAIPMGQEVTTTAIQLARAIAIIANNGYMVKPRVVKYIADEDGHHHDDLGQAEPGVSVAGQVIVGFKIDRLAVEVAHDPVAAVRVEIGTGAYLLDRFGQGLNVFDADGLTGRCPGRIAFHRGIPTGRLAAGIEHIPVLAASGCAPPPTGRSALLLAVRVSVYTLNLCRATKAGRKVTVMRWVTN